MKIFKLEDHKQIYKDEKIMAIIGLAMFNPTEGRVKSAAEGIYSKQQGSFYMAEENDEIIGIIGVRRVDNAFVEITHIAVREDYQKKGIGSQLVDYVNQAERVDRIIAETDYESVDFYKKLGFKIKEKQDIVTGFVRYACTLEC